MRILPVVLVPNPNVNCSVLSGGIGGHRVGLVNMYRNHQSEQMEQSGPRKHLALYPN